MKENEKHTHTQIQKDELLYYLKNLSTYLI